MIPPLKIARTAASKYQLPKTKAPFARFLATLPGDTKLDPGDRYSCPLAKFMQARAKVSNMDVRMSDFDYQVGTARYATPGWAAKFQIAAIRSRPVFTSVTVAKLLEVLETV